MKYIEIHLTYYEILHTLQEEESVFFLPGLTLTSMWISWGRIKKSISRSDQVRDSQNGFRERKFDRIACRILREKGFHSRTGKQKNGLS